MKNQSNFIVSKYYMNKKLCDLSYTKIVYFVFVITLPYQALKKILLFTLDELNISCLEIKQNKQSYFFEFKLR